MSWFIGDDIAPSRPLSRTGRVKRSLHLAAISVPFPEGQAIFELARSLRPCVGGPHRGSRFILIREEIVMKKTLATIAIASLLAGCAVSRQQETVGQYVDDATITTHVKAKFADDSTVAATSIRVETLKGQVQLSGFAKSAEEKSRAEILARSVKGVASVRNDIVVRTPS
jgi:hypothetical protein